MNFLSYLINGISLGSVYAIIALGYTMVYGIAKMLNFAHGDVIMVGCYIVFMTMSGQGWGAVPAVVLSIIVCTVLGIVIEKIAYKPLRKAAPLAVLITAIGVSYFLENAALLIFGADTRSFTNVVTLPALKLAGGALTISGTTIVTFLACVVIMAALMLFIKKTKAGQRYIQVSLRKKQNCYLQFYRKTAKGFRQIKLMNNYLQRGHRKINIAYSRKTKTVTYKIRIYKQVNGRRKYSKFTKVKKMRLK